MGLSYNVLSQAYDDLVYGASHLNQDKISSSLRIFIGHVGTIQALAEAIRVPTSTLNGWTLGKTPGALLIRKLDDFARIVDPLRPVEHPYTDAQIKAVSKLEEPSADALSFLIKTEAGSGIVLDEVACVALLQNYEKSKER